MFRVFMIISLGVFGRLVFIKDGGKLALVGVCNLGFVVGDFVGVLEGV